MVGVVGPHLHAGGQTFVVGALQKWLGPPGEGGGEGPVCLGSRRHEQFMIVRDSCHASTWCPSCEPVGRQDQIPANYTQVHWAVFTVVMVFKVVMVVMVFKVVMVGRHNQELEQDSVAMHEEQRKLEREARSLALRLDAVLKDKFTARTTFDADTPIDKTLKFLQEVIAVSMCSSERNVAVPSRCQ